MPALDRRTSGRVVFVGFALVAGFYLVTEHRAHLFGVLPYLILLACPLMHLFMQHGHGGHGSHDHRPEKPHQGEPGVDGTGGRP